MIVLDAGTGGTLLTNRLRRQLDRTPAEIVLDADDEHVYPPACRSSPSEMARPEALVRSRQRQLRAGTAFHRSSVHHVDHKQDTVLLAEVHRCHITRLSSPPARG
jgi:sulfide:quinone oxidoreductase